VTDHIVAAAPAALGDLLSDPVDLGGNDRSIVLRCRSAMRGTVIVKAYLDTAMECFLAETACATGGPP